MEVVREGYGEIGWWRQPLRTSAEPTGFGLAGIGYDGPVLCVSWRLAVDGLRGQN